MKLKPYMNVILATRNPAKEDRYKNILAPIKGLVTVNLDSLKITIADCAETGDTVDKNAIIKANHYYKATKSAVFASDEGMFLDFDDGLGSPGVHARRLVDGIRPLTDEEIIEYWVKRLKDAPQGAGGCWRYAYVMLEGNRKVTGTVESKFEFAKQPAGEYVPGYPLSSMCLVKGLDKLYTEMTSEEKKEHYDEMYGEFRRNIEKGFCID